MIRWTNVLGALGFAVIAGPAAAQLSYVVDAREVFVQIERLWLLNGFPINEVYEEDIANPPAPYDDFDADVAVNIELGADSYFRATAAQVSQLTPTMITGAGSTWAEEGMNTPACDADYYTLTEGFSRIYVEFTVDEDAILRIEAEQTVAQGDAQVAVSFRQVDGTIYLDEALSADAADQYEGVFRVPPGQYRFIAWNSLGIFCEPGVVDRSDYTTTLEWLGSPCNDADMAAPTGVLDLADVQGFLSAFLAGDALADLAEPFGVWDLADIQAFVGAFNAGCP